MNSWIYYIHHQITIQNVYSAHFSITSVTAASEVLLPMLVCIKSNMINLFIQQH